MLQDQKSPDGNFSSRMETRMRQHGLSGAELARLTGLAAPNISRYLKGRIPAAEELLKISRALGVTMEWLLTGSDELPSGIPTVLMEDLSQYRTERSASESMRLALCNLGAAVNDLKELFENEAKQKS